MSSALLQPEEHVLSTLNADGSRRWLSPKVSRGGWWRARRAVAWLLILVFCTLPHLTINDKPAVLLDIVRREFTIFGKTFLATDTLLLMLLVVGIFVTVFLATAVLGRVWCGWGCPQTVYMEFVFRPLERFFDGEPGKPAPKSLPVARTVAKYAVFLVISAFLAHTFLAYFVGSEQLRHWVFESPAAHLTGFTVVMLVTALMMFDFSFFREQMCIVACPYGRFQSVMLDQHSLIVSYDPARGEPRGKGKRTPVAADLSLKVLSAPTATLDQSAADEKECCGCEGGNCKKKATTPAKKLGDCVDCGLCTAVCPTGIDIRQGLQMECINCTQCIDACDAVMTKLKLPTGLIRYTSQHALAGKKRGLRPRVVIYPLVLVIIASVFVWRLAGALPFDSTILRQRGLPFNTLPSGEITNQMQVKLTNRTEKPARYTITLPVEDVTEGLKIVASENPLEVRAGETRVEPFLVTVPRGAFFLGKRDVRFVITDEGGIATEISFRLLGPAGSAAKHEQEEQHERDEREEHEGQKSDDAQPRSKS